MTFLQVPLCAGTYKESDISTIQREVQSLQKSLDHIAKSVDTSKFSIYADIPEFNTGAGGTIPPSLTVTADKPDIVIIDEKKKAAAIFELTPVRT